MTSILFRHRRRTPPLLYIGEFDHIRTLSEPLSSWPRCLVTSYYTRDKSPAVPLGSRVPITVCIPTSRLAQVACVEPSHIPPHTLTNSRLINNRQSATHFCSIVRPQFREYNFGSISLSLLSSNSRVDSLVRDILP